MVALSVSKPGPGGPGPASGAQCVFAAVWRLPLQARILCLKVRRPDCD